jgi:sugar lactone lactonase YvrE
MMLEAATNRVVVASNRVSRSSALGPGSPITYANDLDIAKNGSVFFTTSVDMTLHK